MSSHLQTTIENTSSTVILIAPSCVFVTQLTAAIQALHVFVVRIDPDRLVETMQSETGRQLFSHAYICLYLDIPLFTDQEKKKSWIDHQLTQLRSALRIPIYFVLFDAHHVRKTGREGVDPISTSPYLASQATVLFESAKVFDYHHMIYPYEGGLSLVQRMIFEKIQQENRAQLLGDCTPLWYADVISHLTSVLCEANPTGGIFSGHQTIPMYTLEEHLRHRSHLPAIKQEALEFPFVMEKALGIGDTSIEMMIDQLALVTPKPSVSVQEDVQIQAPVMVPKRPEVKKKTGLQKKKSSLLKFVGVIVGVVCLMYIVTAVYFFVSLVGMRSQLQSFLQSDSSSSLRLEEIHVLQDRLALIRMISTRVPLPYSAVGMSLHGSEVAGSIDNLMQLLSGIDHSMSASDQLVSLMQGRESNQEEAHTRISATLEDSYKELSQVQARLAQQDLSLDLLLGIDGFSRELLTRVASIRESVSQQKALSSVIAGILDGTEDKTIALVRADTSVARPLFGVPKEVVILSVQGGKIATIKGYDIDELDSMLKGKVDPPEEMQLSTDSTLWRLSDGAWSIDGNTAARQIAWFLSKQLHVDVDALLMIDDTQIRKSKMALSPESNIQPKVLGTESSTGDLKALVDNVKTADKRQVQSLTQTLAKAVQESKLTVYVREASGAKTIRALAWDGGILTPPCPPTFAIDRECRLGYFYLAEYDVEKASGDTFSQKKDQIHTIKVSEEKMEHSNRVVFGAPKNGVQRKLLKYVIDEAAVPMSLSINGNTQDISTEMIGQEFGKKTVSIPLSLEVGADTSVELVYSDTSIPNEKSTYAFFVQKQPGKQSEPFSLHIIGTKDYIPKIIAPTAAIQRSTITFTTTLDTNKLFAIGY